MDFYWYVGSWFWYGQRLNGRHILQIKVVGKYHWSGPHRK